MMKASHPVHSPAFMAWFQQQRAFAAPDPSRTFVAATTVTLAHWEDLDEATCWCISRLRDEGRLFRRKIDAARRIVIFEFDSRVSDVVWFRLRYG